MVYGKDIQASEPFAIHFHVKGISIFQKIT